MATFELNSDAMNRGRTAGYGERFEREQPGSAEPAQEPVADTLSLHPIRQESVISMKVYDSCRQQDCLDGDELGPARSAVDQTLDGKHYREGEVIDPPRRSASVSIDCLRVKKIIIIDKRHNAFKRGFWDLDIKYVFEYCLEFREINGEEIGCLRAVSVFNKRVTLFGSIGADIVIATDLLRDTGDESPTLSMDPFVLVEAKAVPLSAKLKQSRLRHNEDDNGPNEVIVTIGLFTIIKLFRIVTLLVESRGFGIPGRCHEFSPVNVCDHFDRMPFPMDVFSPPQRAEFDAGVSGDIPSGRAETADECVEC